MTFPNATHYSEHFSRAELDCGKNDAHPCDCKTPATVQARLAILAAHLETLRTLAGRGLTPNCGYRCPKRNAAVGGAKGSFHLTGQAADLDCKGSRAEVDRLAKLAEKVSAFKAAGIGRYYEGHGLFLHVDFGNRFWRGIDGK